MISMPKECHHYTSRHFGVIWELTDILRVLKRLCWHNLCSPFWFAVQWDTCSVQVCRYRLLEDEFSNPSVPDIQKYLTDEDYRWLVYRSAFRCWFIYFLQHSLTKASLSCDPLWYCVIFFGAHALLEAP